ncbi:hypothetical protein [Parendozoicomonas haliclonae]|uniref:Uncharacterized protein n=1 Tax=Parendozoicomonas haliclonae TaxID=1960125 RepID=A0A1X7AQ95_9GAMM|nr:hypothetical protein [Parendozoicomonas haliclonae]SMA50466.1 hypothetical protein EHSB41UT_04277 [Parendozoicomonas haliclonae]
MHLLTIWRGLLAGLLLALFLGISLGIGSVQAEDFLFPANEPDTGSLLQPSKATPWEEPEAVRRWYATSPAGTFVVSGNRVLLFENVQLPQELAEMASGLLTGALWKEGYLLSHELFLSMLWPSLPKPVQQMFRGVSQGWLLWTLMHSLVQVGSPLAVLVRDYYRYWNASHFQGTMPVAVNDAELSFRVFVQADFPDAIEEPAGFIIDKVPAMSALPTLVRRHDHLNPWNRLLDEMSRSDISRLRLSGDRDGVITVRFQDAGLGGAEQRLVAAVNQEYNPSPWLLEKIRNREDRKDIHLYTSLLSQDVLELMVRMLECRRLSREQPELEGQCKWGRMVKDEGGLEFLSDHSVAPSQIWERRDYPGGRALSLTGCAFSTQPLCWENTLVMGDGSKIYPWPSLSLYSRFSSFKERNDWVLLGHEPQIWFTGSFFQLRVPELFTRFLLSAFSAGGQIAVNRMVTSLHHKLWGNGFVPGKPKPLPESVEAPNQKEHAMQDGYDCLECNTPQCRYTLCHSCKFRFDKGPMVDLGCSRSRDERHQVCTSCFKNLISITKVKPCDQCDAYHMHMIRESNYHIDPDEDQQMVKSAPRCPVCRVLFDSRRGNIVDNLRGECGALWMKLKWLFSDSLGVDSPPQTTP